ncbi:CRISPR type IV/AFERR-associated protein Csf2 [Pseudomonas saponiphila]|uniref:CRISPR type IV/AFERR-associated protein Csf2 n=1 Tax=Pseudomonas saponiphila TaxID=556534 RepID=A0A1H4ZC51_9PSED|nr:RAMP superfamily CRISPR-associated protein [Pseudomonas saponiphila]SED27762.1 CRISPR type IV/AFERR-associated protein Csf2 [Pseudomonas saponiphila]
MTVTHYVLEGEIKAEQPLATCSKALKDAEGGSDLPIPVPHMMTPEGNRLYFPATGIRGKLRRALRDVLRENEIKRTGNDKPLSLDQHYLLTLGGIMGEDKKDKATVDQEAMWRERNVLLSLFGAGDAGYMGMVHGRLAVGNAICESVSQPHVFSGVRSDDLYRDRSQVAFLSHEDINALIAQSEGNRDASAIKKEIATLDKARKTARAAKDTDRVNELSDKIEQLKASIEAVKVETGAKNSVGMPLAGWQAIPEGAVMRHRFMINNANEVELGALLVSLDRFAAMPTLGAHIAAGCGLISARWELFEVVPGAGKTSLGVLVLEPFVGLNVDAPPTSEIFSAWQAFLDYLAGDQFNLSIPSAAAC